MSSESFYPHAFLLQPSSSKTILASGPYLQLIDNATGNVLKSTVQQQQTTSSSQDENQIEARKKKEKGAAQPPQPFIRCAALSGPPGVARCLVTAGDDKVLRVYDVEDLTLMNERELPKRPTDVCFTRDARTIVVGDKFGDVFSYSVEYESAPVPSTPTQKTRESIVSHENPSNGTLILGHTSLLTAFLLSKDEKYIITADRDEHIRVSWFPQGYVIETFCLAHQKYVTAIHNPSFAPAELVSGGGDSYLCIWDWQSGKLLHKIHGILDAVEPFVKVQSRKRKNWDGRDDEAEGEIKGEKRGKKAKKRGKKNPNKQGADEEGVEEAEVQETGAVTEGNPSQGDVQEDGDKKILVIRRITTVLGDNGRQHIVFSAVGTTALFSIPYPNTESSKTSTTPTVSVLDLGFPVTDFTVTEQGKIFVLLDGNWGADPSLAASSKKWATTAKIALNGELEEIPSESSPLLSSLNSSYLIAATTEDLQKLDLYSDITSLPKWSGPDGGAVEAALEDSQLPTPLDTPTPSFASPNEIGMVGEQGKGPMSLSKRLLGRQRKKDAVKEKLQQHSSSATPRAETPVEEPHHKRARTEENEDEGDVAMQES